MLLICLGTNIKCILSKLNKKLLTKKLGPAKVCFVQVCLEDESNKFGEQEQDLIKLKETFQIILSHLLEIILAQVCGVDGGILKMFLIKLFTAF